MRKTAASIAVSMILSINAAVSPMAHTAFADDDDVKLEGMLYIDNIQEVEGESVTMDIGVMHNPGLICMGLDISYDDSKLRLRSVENRYLFWDAEFSKCSDLSANPYRICWDDNPDENYRDTGLLATLTFDIVSGEYGDATVNVEADPDSTFDIDLNDVPFYSAGADIYIEEPLGPPAVFYLGDVNFDGMVDSTDATLVLVEYAALSTGNPSTFTTTETMLADVNSDGMVDSSDASAMLSFYSYHSTGGTETDIEAWLKSEEADQ